MKIKINHGIAGRREGDIINVESKDGVPRDNFWRRRLRDAKRDNCCEVVKSSPPKKKEVKKEVIDG